MLHSELLKKYNDLKKVNPVSTRNEKDLIKKIRSELPTIEAYRDMEWELERSRAIIEKYRKTMEYLKNGTHQCHTCGNNIKIVF
jgi:hypothetical protein